MPKYGNKKTVVNGITFDSKREADRYIVLLHAWRTGGIIGLAIQPEWELVPATVICGKKQRPVKYRADFMYYKDGQQIVEDSKGMRTKDYIIKRKLMKHVHNIDVVEV